MQFKLMVENEYKSVIKCLRTDIGGGGGGGGWGWGDFYLMNFQNSMRNMI